MDVRGGPYRRTETKAAILWPPDAKNQFIGKDPDAGKDGRPEEKWSTEDELVGWHHWLLGHGFENTPGDSEGQGSHEVCCSPWGSKDQTLLSSWTTAGPVLTRVQCLCTFFNMYMYLFFQILFPFRLLQNVEQSSLCYIIGSFWCVQSFLSLSL